MMDLLGFMFAYGATFALGAAAIARVACGTGEVLPEERAPRAELPVARVVRR